ncbi:MAG: GspH/FimT family pseudopilin [Burkholderiales bacterium]
MHPRLIRSPHRRSGPGFTLIEMMVVIAIAAILLTIGLPNLRDFLADQRVRTAASDLVSEIALARARAIQDSRRVYFQRTAVDWKDGWIIFVDQNSNGAYDNGEEIKISQGLPGRLRICSTVTDFGTNLIFRPDGRVVRTTAVGANDGLYLVDELGDTDPTNNKIRGLLFGTSGRVTTLKANGVAPPC